VVKEMVEHSAAHSADVGSNVEEYGFAAIPNIQIVFAAQACENRKQLSDRKFQFHKHIVHSGIKSTQSGM
jgi:hypothetical protein